ncbi:MAG: hypothetical protein V7782_05935, partial [Psychromonas sp.]
MNIVNRLFLIVIFAIFALSLPVSSQEISLYWAEPGPGGNPGLGGDPDGEDDNIGPGGDNDCDNGDIGGGCGDNGPTQEEKDADKINSDISEKTDTMIEAVSKEGPAADQFAYTTEFQNGNALTDYGLKENLASEKDLEGATSGCPVELYSGCKVTRETDVEHPLFSLTRQHRLSQGSAWSLGAGWHSALDSRIIWGVDIDIQPQIDASQDVVDEYNELLSSVDLKITELQESFVDRIGYNEPGVIENIDAAVAELQALKAPYDSKLIAAQVSLEQLQASKALSDLYRARNVHTTDQDFPLEYEIGVNKVKWISPQGGRQLFELNPLTQVITARAGNNYQLVLQADNKINIIATNGETFHYNEHGFLVKVSNNNGRWVEILRDTNHQATQLSDELGRSFNFIYSDNRLRTISDRQGRSTRFKYQSGQLVKVERYDGRINSYQYNYAENHLAITAKSDGEDNKANYEYKQQLGKTVVVLQIDPDGNKFHYQYDFAANSTTVINRNGTQTHYQYDDNNQVVSKIFESDGSEISKLYDANGNLAIEYNELGDTSIYSYNEANHLESMTDPEGRTISYVRDLQGRILTQSNNAGESTTFDYDQTGRIRTITLADGSVIEQTWQNNLLSEHIDPVGNLKSYQYDALGYPTRIETRNNNSVDGDAFVQTMQYDNVGRVLWISEGSANTPAAQWRTTRYYYLTEEGQSLDKPTRIIDPLGREARFEYDSNAQVLYHLDFSGIETRYSYTARQLVATKQIRQAQQQYNYRYQYDAENNLVKAIHPGGLQWQYDYDSRNRLIRSQLLNTQVNKSFSYDAAGRRITATDSTGNTTQYRYFADGQIEAVSNPLGNTVEYQYDNAGRVNAVYDQARGTYTSDYQRNELGHITQTTDGNQHQTSIGVNPLGQIKTVSIPNSSVERISRELDWRGNPLALQDVGGGQFTYQYNAFGQVTRIVDSEGGEQRFDYDALGRLIFQKNTAGLETRWLFEQQASQLVVTQTQTDTSMALAYIASQRKSVKNYDLMGRLLAYSDAEKQQWQFTYNKQGLLSDISNPDGTLVSKEYNLAGQMIAEIIKSVNGQSRGTYYSYDGEGRMVTEQLPHYSFGQVNRYQYNALDQVSSVTLPDGSYYEYQYDAAGRKTAAFDPLGATESWRFDGNDNAVAYTDKDGFLWQYSYSADNQISEIIDPENGSSAPTLKQFDDMGRLIASTNPQGQRTSQTLDTLGRITGAVDAMQQTNHYQLDVAGRPVLMTNRVGQSTTQQFNAFDEVLAITDPIGNTTAFTYDRLGRVIAKQDTLDASEQWAYNYREQVTLYTNKLGQQSQNQYNGFGNLTSLTEANGASSQYQWNAANKLTEVTSPEGASQTLVYDEMARLTQFSNELGEQWRYDYNQLGQVSSAYQPASDTDINFNYDQRGNLVERQYNSNNQLQSEQFSFDGLGRLANINSPTLSESYRYDGANNLVQVNNQTLGKDFNYQYDANGQRTSSQMTSDVFVTYQRDAEGRITRVNRETRNGIQSFDLSYNANDQVTAIDYPNHSRRSVEYDALGRVSQIDIEQEEFRGNRWRGNWQNIEQLQYQYDAQGNVLAQNRKTEADSDEQWAHFEYDQVNRLINADYPKQDDISYEWDNNGNLITKQSKTHRFSYNYNDANQLEAFNGHRLPGFACDDPLACDADDNESSNDQWFTYQYDANGYMTSVDDGSNQQTFTHDPLGRMTSVYNPDGSSVSYAYGARSRLIITERTLQSDALGVIEESSNQSSNGKGKGKGNSQNQSQSDASISQSGIITLYSHFDGRQEQGQWQQASDGFEPFRSLTLLPQQGLPYGDVLHQALFDTKSQLMQASGTKGADIANLYPHHDRLGSAISVLDDSGKQAMRLGYSPFGQVYRKHTDKTFWKLNSGVNANKQLGQLMPYQFTGKYTDGNTGLVQMDSRWYN